MLGFFYLIRSIPECIILLLQIRSVFSMKHSIETGDLTFTFSGISDTMIILIIVKGW